MVAIVLRLLPGMAVSWQLFVWAVASIAFTFLWFKFLKPLMTDRTKAGISREAVLGESGQVIKIPQADRRGIVRFATPLLGADEWPFICEQEVGSGDRVFVKDISASPNAKVVVLPADLPAAVKELLNVTGKSV